MASSCPKCGGPRVIKVGSGRAKCLDCHKSFNASLAGFSPEHDMRHTVPDGFTVKGVSTLYDRDGKVAAQWVKSDQDKARALKILQDEFLLAAKEIPRAKPVKARSHYASDLMACYPIGDAHIGMRSWAEETGADFDLAIAERRQCDAMAALVASAPAAESALVVNLGDFLHYDSLEAKTPRSGHLLDADGRYAKVVRVAVRVMRQCIDSALRKHQRVRVVNAIGNHDETGAIWLSVALAAAYENEPRVEIDQNPSLFTYVEHGRCLIGVHHGHTCKPDKLPGVMAADKPEAWGRTRHRYWWLGHVHHQAVKEHPGCVVESWNTLASNDAYAAAGGWRSREQMSCVVLHREHGEVARLMVNPRMLDDEAGAATSAAA